MQTFSHTCTPHIARMVKKGDIKLPASNGAKGKGKKAKRETLAKATKKEIVKENFEDEVDKHNTDEMDKSKGTLRDGRGDV